MSFSPAGGANSAPPSPLAGFDGPFRGGKKAAKREGRGGKERKEREGENTSSLEINFWLRPCT